MQLSLNNTIFIMWIKIYYYLCEIKIYEKSKYYIRNLQKMFTKL
jgi:hypothetical protein